MPNYDGIGAKQYGRGYLASTLGSASGTKRKRYQKTPKPFPGKNDPLYREFRLVEQIFTIYPGLSIKEAAELLDFEESQVEDARNILVPLGLLGRVKKNRSCI